jgi:hypothetical protein
MKAKKKNVIAIILGGARIWLYPLTEVDLSLQCQLLGNID